jgi:hypothetical protein
LLKDVSWQFENILDELGETRAAKGYYSKEIVEIMKTGESIEHTQGNAYIRHLKVIFPVKP